MRAKNIALVLIVLVIGFGAGYTLSYAIYQPQIISLTMEIENLRAQMNDLETTISNLTTLIAEINNKIQGLRSGSCYENLEFTSAYITYGDNRWVVVITLKNTGLTYAEIDNILLDGKSYTHYSGITISPSPNIIVNVGSSITITISIPNTYPFQPSATIEIRLHTTSGKEYPKTITLP